MVHCWRSLEALRVFRQYDVFLAARRLHECSPDVSKDGSWGMLIAARTFSLRTPVEIKTI